MSITIEDNIPEYNAAYNEQELAVSSDQVGQPGFHYVFRVNVEGIAGFKEFWVLPEPSQQYGVKDFSGYVERFVHATIFDPDSTAAFEYATGPGIQSIVKYDIDIYELWNTGSPAEPTLDPDGNGAVNTGDKYAFEASFPHHEWIDEQNEATPYNQWFLNPTNGTAGEFLTDNKLPRVKQADHGWTYLLTDQPADVDFVEIVTYDEDDNVIQTVNINNLLVSSNTTARMLRVATSPASLNAVVGGIVLGSQPIVTDAVKSYTIQCFQSGPNVVSEILSFTVEEPCRYEPIRIHFLNQYGGFDSFNFNWRNQESDSTKKANGMYDPYRVVSGGLSYENQDSSKGTLQTTTTTNIKARSEYLTEAENDWLRQLFRTRKIFLEKTNKAGNTDLYPISDIRGPWSQKVKSIDKLFNLDVDFTMSWDDHSQRR